jgi:hypothetical protein
VRPAKIGICRCCKQRKPTYWTYLSHPDPPTADRDDYIELCRDCNIDLDGETRRIQKLDHRYRLGQIYLPDRYRIALVNERGEPNGDPYGYGLRP